MSEGTVVLRDMGCSSSSAGAATRDTHLRAGLVTLERTGEETNRNNAVRVTFANLSNSCVSLNQLMNGQSSVILEKLQPLSYSIYSVADGDVETGCAFEVVTRRSGRRVKTFIPTGDEEQCCVIAEDDCVSSRFAKEDVAFLHEWGDSCAAVLTGKARCGWRGLGYVHNPLGDITKECIAKVGRSCSSVRGPVLGAYLHANRIPALWTLTFHPIASPALDMRVTLSGCE